MEARIQKWGNSLALRIPKAFAEETGLREDVAVELTIRDGVLCVAPRLTLESLMRDVTDQNIHREVGTGDPVGNEVW
jgi:antitoxin MazE